MLLRSVKSSEFHVVDRFESSIKAIAMCGANIHVSSLSAQQNPLDRGYSRCVVCRRLAAEKLLGSLGRAPAPGAPIGPPGDRTHARRGGFKKKEPA